MQHRAHGLRVTALALAVALAGTTAIVAPVAATDPVPVESPAPSPSPTPDPSATPSETPSSPVATPTPSVDPSPSAVPAPSQDPAPSAAPSATADPSASPDPAASVAPTPTADPAPALTSVVAPAPRPVVVPNLGLRVVRIALAQRGDQYRAGGQSPSYFDCSGLVRYSYRKAGVSAKLGGGSSARGMLYWGRLHGLTSSRNPRIGDVAIYGNGTHAGIWIGNGRVVQALNPRLDIRVLGLHAVTKPFTTFIHTRIPRG